MRHINIPIFIPHMGCPNQCVFCNQRTISGACFFERSDAGATVERVLSTAAEDDDVEIAFFGGSFTGIERSLMTGLLDDAERYVALGRVRGIRMSTRPDYIDGEIIEILKKYTVTQVELGIQSMSDRVLGLCRRGHTAEDSRRAVAMLRDAGFEVAGQMMIGLPGSSAEDEVMTAREICSMGCSASRIYPTVVFKDTELCRMCREGEYEPLGLDEAVERSADALDVFERSGVRCLRVGLCESENLHSEETYVAGPNHSAVGELVMSRLFYKRIKKEIDALFSVEGRVLGERSGDNSVERSGERSGEKRDIEIQCPRGSVSKVVGNKKQNKCKILREYPVKRIKVVENPRLLGYNIKVICK